MWDNVKTSIISTWGSCDLESLSGRYSNRPIPLSVGADETPVIIENGYVAFVNPYSENRAQAEEFLEALIDGFSAYDRAQFSPKDVQPMRNTYYEENIKWEEEWIASLEESLANAGNEETRRMTEEQLSIARKDLEDMIANDWLVSEKGIQLYQSLMEYFCFPTNSILYSSEIYTLQTQLAGGEITVQEMLAEMDRQLIMMMREGE